MDFVKKTSPEDYIVVVVWGTLALEQLNATTTTVEDYMRGQLLLGTEFMGGPGPISGRVQAEALTFWKASKDIHLKLNIAPEKLPSQKESSLATIIFQGLCWTSGV